MVMSLAPCQKVHMIKTYACVGALFQVPWADLRYLFGEIMYGGHIVNDFDRWGGGMGRPWGGQLSAEK